MLNDTGNQNPAPTPAPAAPPDWVTALPESIRTEEAIPTLSKFTGASDADFVRVPATLAKSYVEAQKALGKKGVPLPNEKSTPEEWATFYGAIGRPASAADYGLAKPDGLPDGLYDEERVKAFAEAVHGLGLTKAQTEGLFSYLVGTTKSDLEAQTKHAQQTHERAIAEYKKQYGENFEKVDAAITQAVEQIGGEQLREFLIASGLRDVPILMNAFKRVADMMGEHKIVDGRVATGGGEQITQAKLEEMMRDPRYSGGWDAKGVRIFPDPDWQRKVREGFQRLYPDTPRA